MSLWAGQYASRERFGEHSLWSKNVINSVPCHLSQVHGDRTQGLELFGIEAIPMTITEGERFSRLCLRETLNTRSPGGLNKELEINFLISCWFQLLSLSIIMADILIYIL